MKVTNVRGRSVRDRRQGLGRSSTGSVRHSLSPSTQAVSPYSESRRSAEGRAETRDGDVGFEEVDCG